MEGRLDKNRLERERERERERENGGFEGNVGWLEALLCFSNTSKGIPLNGMNYLIKGFGPGFIPFKHTYII
ncbi:unnamed protein product [Camellia sinensis]